LANNDPTAHNWNVFTHFKLSAEGVMKTILLAAGAVGLFVLANSLAVQYGETRRLAILAICGITATAAYVFFAFLGAHKGLAATSAVVDVLIVVGSVLVGVILRGERLAPVQVVGIVMGLAATAIILFGARPAAAP
jgi:drug/metabolite transporter (DMT)-like permease